LEQRGLKSRHRKVFWPVSGTEPVSGSILGTMLETQTDIAYEYSLPPKGTVHMASGINTDSIVRFLKTDNGQRLVISAYSIIATVVLYAFSGTGAAYVVGIPYLFFVPGFALVRLFFWTKTSPEAKFVLSMGLSILAVIFLGLFLVLTPIGLDSDTTRASLIVFTLVAVILEAFVKPAETKPEEKTPEAKARRAVKVDLPIAAMLGTALVISAISLGLIITADYPSTTYFAITDENGSADINTTLTHNTTMTVILHMKNGEDGLRTFTMIAHNDTLFDQMTFTRDLAKGETWNETVAIDMVYWGVFRLDFDLYIQEEGEPQYFYGNLHLWIDVQ